MQSFSRNCMNVHHIHRFLDEQDEENCFAYENNCLSTRINKGNASKTL